jgi:hypothetical protein
MVGQRIAADIDLMRFGSFVTLEDEQAGQTEAFLLGHHSLIAGSNCLYLVIQALLLLSLNLHLQSKSSHSLVQNLLLACALNILLQKKQLALCL